VKNLDTVRFRPQVTEHSAAPQTNALPRENSGGSALNVSSQEQKIFFLIRTAEGKRIELDKPIIRITPDHVGFCLVESYDLGVWKKELTTPYTFEVARVGCKSGCES